MKLNKEDWTKLAEAVHKDHDALQEIYEAKQKINKKYGLDTDFVGMDCDNLKMFDAALSILGEEFDYFLFECGGKWDEYNQRVTYTADGSHPNIHSYEDLYEESRKMEE